jgi:uncharacterized protein YecT (DUF1311 family)
MVAAIAAALFMTVGGPARAEDCHRAMAQADMDSCAEQDFENADTALNLTYQALQERLDDHGRAALRSAELAWIRWRDAECGSRTLHSEGGTIRPVELAECRADLTKARTDQLHNELACQTGSNTCIHD